MDQKETQMTQIDETLRKELDAEREEDIRNLLAVVEAAYRQKRISKSANNQEIIFTVHVPHGQTKEEIELFRLAGRPQP